MNRLFRVTAGFLLAVSAIAPVAVNGHPENEPDLMAAQSGGRCGYIGHLRQSTVKPANVVIPQEINIPPTEGVFYLRLFARGTQNYRCDVDSGNWTFIEPKALLFNSKKSKSHIGRHFFLGRPDRKGGQAVWAGLDVQQCGAVVTKKIAQAASPDGPDNIAWLKTATTSTSGPPAGILSKANFVQRVLTKGGQPPPKQACGKEFTNGQIFTSSYTTEYWYYRRP